MWQNPGFSINSRDRYMKVKIIYDFNLKSNTSNDIHGIQVLFQVNVYQFSDL